MAGVNLTFTLIGRDHSASSALRSVGDESEKAHGKLGKLGGMGKVAGLAVATGVGAAAAGAVVAGKAMWDMTKAAAEDEKSQVKLAKALENQAGASKTAIAGVEAWITKQGAATGVADDKMRPALARLVGSTHDVGEAQKMAALAQDIAAGSGKDYVTVAGALAKANDGQFAALKKLGITWGEQTGNANEYHKTQNQLVDLQGKAAVALEAHGAKSKEYAAAQGRVADKQAALNSLAKEGIDWQADLAQQFEGQSSAAANTFEGKMGRLRLMFDETKESIGAKLLPVAEKLGSWVLDKGVPAIGHLGEKVLPVLKSWWDKITTAFDEARPGLERIGTLLLTVGKWVGEDVLPALGKLSSFMLGNLIKAIGFLGDHLDEIGAGVLKAAGFIVGGFKSVYTVVTGVLEGILTVAEKTMGWIPGIGDKIKAAKAGFSDFRDHSIEKISQVEASIKAAARTLDDYDEKARAERVAKLTADKSDLESKLATAKERLNDPDLTKERRAELKANIAELQKGVKDANDELEKLPTSREVRLRVAMEVHADYKARQVSGGGMGGDGGTAPGRGLMAATAGVGHPGTGFGAWGPMWSWNRNPRTGMGQHDGADIAAGYGTSVYATRSGRIVDVGTTGWAGNHVVWEAGGTRYIYAHLSKILKSSGAVSAGTLLGRVGATGNATGAHLHVQASRDGHYVNPAAYLASGGIVRARPGGVPVVIGEGAYDEAVIPLPKGGGLGGDVIINITVEGGLDSAETIARRIQTSLLDLKRRQGVPLGLG